VKTILKKMLAGVLGVIRMFKTRVYFFVAYYFRFFAKIQLNIWKPRIIVVTGSSGKTTLLHLIQSQLKTQARYSHRVNSTYGIPFDILGLKRKTFFKKEWLFLFLTAPFCAFKKPYKENIYIVEVDCDRTGEGKFLGTLLKPEVTLWLNTGKTHGANFEKSIKQHKFSSIEEAVAYEFGYLIQHTTKLIIINGDVKLITDQLNRFKGHVEIVKEKQLDNYGVSENGTIFEIDKIQYSVKYLLPKESFYSVEMSRLLTIYLNIKFDQSFSEFYLPPSRSTIFKGIKNTTLIDSSYNATPDGMVATIKMFNQYPAKFKWLVLGDMIELGSKEQEEHEKLAKIIISVESSKTILVGHRVAKFTYPKLLTLLGDNSSKLIKFELPKEALDYIVASLGGGETILFKGARFLEGVIEHLLVDKNDINKLCRREEVWQIRRKQWGL
jgi:UDP-N-acetylmuramoyl-tripeptide--D-alanyl-D-alanine ligase